MTHENEAQTRALRIDQQLARAGWTRESRRLVDELCVPSERERAVENDLVYRISHEFLDYGLLDRLRRPVGIVEAKRTSRNALEGERQAADYADQIKRIHGIDPFIFLANGDEIWFWHRRLYPPRKVSGFFTEEDLERLAYLDQFHEPLAGAAVNPSIVDRGYQIDAVKTIAEQIETARRKFLMVLATGTGKTRVAIALIELLHRCKWIQRVLFLADRRELVKQALGAFKDHLPDVPRCWIEGGDIDRQARVHAATYPGMMSLFRRLSPGYYDLIIADESHRSIYNRYKAILDHFDSIQLGLTATPTDFLDHDTFRLFDCLDGDLRVPTYHYGYEEAVRDRYLVPYRPVHVAKTVFQIDGLQPGELPEEVKEQVRRQGIDPDDFSFEGSDLERRVTVTGTNDAIVREFMDYSIKDAAGTLPAKSILFAVSHRHALELYQSFNRLYPDLQRRGLAKVIDSHMERADKTLDDFKNKDFPRVAISVDMLDTGIDVPAIRNLVFAKPVFSKVKFWQMIGRGTRRWTDPVSGQEKTDFLIIDHWDNFSYFQVNTDGREGSVSEPLPTRLFRLRLEKRQILQGRAAAEAAQSALRQLQTMLADLPLENVNVAPHAQEIRTLTTDTAGWEPIDDAKVRHLSQTIAPLLRFTASTTYAELQFENLTEQLALAHLKADDGEAERLRGHILENLNLLPVDLPEIRPHLEALTWAKTREFWDHLDYPRIMQLQQTFAPLMRYRQRRTGAGIVRVSLADEIGQRRWIVFGPGGEGTFAENYRAQVEALVRQLAVDNAALQRLQHGQDLTDEELDALSRVLAGPDLFVTEQKLREAYEQPQAGLADFLRHILGLARLPSREEAISQAFDAWIQQHPSLTATQLMFVRTLRQAILRRAEITSLESLRDPPFNGIGDPETLFTKPDLDDILELLQSLAA